MENIEIIIATILIVGGAIAWVLDKPILLIHSKGIEEGVFASEIKDNNLVQFTDTAVNYSIFSTTVKKMVTVLRVKQ